MKYILCSTFIFLVFISSLPSTSIKVNTYFKSSINALFPQGWAFFTKNPREASLKAYQLNSNSDEVLVTNVNNSLSTIFGASRLNRRIYMELSTVEQMVNDKLWLDVDSIISIVDLAKILEPIRISAQNIEHVSGKILLIKETPIPWAWAKLAIASKKKVVLVDINTSESL